MATEIAPCIPITIPKVPTIPSPFSISLPTIPGLSFNANVCCIPLDLGTILPTIPLPPLVINPGVVVDINKALAVVQAWLDALPIACPRQ